MYSLLRGSSTSQQESFPVMASTAPGWFSLGLSGDVPGSSQMWEHLPGAARCARWQQGWLLGTTNICMQEEPRIIKVEKTSKGIKSSLQGIPPWPLNLIRNLGHMKCPLIFWAPPGTRTPLLPWIVSFNAWPSFQKRNFSWYPTWTSPGHFSLSFVVSCPLGAEPDAHMAAPSCQELGRVRKLPLSLFSSRANISSSLSFSSWDWCSRPFSSSIPFSGHKIPNSSKPSLGLFSQQWHKWMIIYPEQFIICILMRIFNEIDDKLCYEINDAKS